MDLRRATFIGAENPLLTGLSSPLDSAPFSGDTCYLVAGGLDILGVHFVTET